MTKPWYLSKTLWAAIIGAVLSIYTAAGAPLGQVPAWIYSVLGAAGLASLRQAIGGLTK
jgi:hypothetical protein